MHNSKLIAILKNIEGKELVKIKKFINSDLNNESREINQQRKLLSLLIKVHPEFTIDNVDKKKVYRHIYKSDFDANKLNRLNGRLLSSIRFYLIHLAKNNFNPVLDNLKEARLYLNNADEALFDKCISKIEKENEKNKTQDHYLFNSYLIENEKLNFNYLYNQRKGKLNIPSTIEKLDHFYYKKKLELTLSLLAQNKFAYKVDTEYAIKNLGALSSCFSNSTILQTPSIKIYHEAINMLNEDDQQAYEKLKKLLSQYEESLREDENKNLHTLARNFCIQQYSLGRNQYLNEAFKCFQHDLSKGYLYHQSGILASTMQAIVKLGLRLHKVDWVYQFLIEHKNRLVGTREPKAIYNYNLAEYYFLKKNFNKCLDLIQENFEDIHYKTSSKRLMIKALYELNSPLLESRINAFKIYIFRISDNAFTALHKEGNNQFIDILKQICNPSTLTNSKRIKSINQKITQTQSVADRPWLIDILNKLQ